MRRRWLVPGHASQRVSIGSSLPFETRRALQTRAGRKEPMSEGRARALLSSYLEEMRAGLCGLPADEMDEILQELRSHILDSAQLRREPAGPGDFGAAPLPRASIEGEISQADMAEALRRLGAPREL